jgi:hypothetical protein
MRVRSKFISEKETLLMMRRTGRWRTILVGLAVVFCSSPLPAFHAGLVDAEGNIVFSAQFVRDYQAAEKEMTATGSVEPYLALLEKSRDSNERAELELTIGVIYCQRTGFVDPEKAVRHLGNALGYRLPETAYLDTLLWRAGSLEQLGKLDDARRDHLRGLLACLQYNTPSEWPELEPPTVAFSIGPDVTEAELQARRDYERYRTRVEFQRHVMMQRYYFVDALQRIGAKAPLQKQQLRSELEKLTPDADQHERIWKLVRSDNKRPWP